ncbi:MAG: DUF6599 family protein [Candidatus Zixiibacteriota bacterium]
MSDLVHQEMLGWKLQEPVETYDRETIFDYIDGAGEVYLMYDFRTVSVFHFAKTDEPEITVEIFDMGSTEDAYGIFSHARELEETGIGQGYEYRGSLLCFWKAQFFVCIMAESETAETKEATFALARSIDKQIAPSGGKPELLAYLPEKGLIPHTIRYFHTHSALNYHFFLAKQNILNLSRETRAVLAEYEPGSTYLLCIQYPSVQEANKGYDSFVKNYVPEAKGTGVAEIEQGKWLAVECESEFLIVVFDVPSEEYARQLIAACVKRLPKSFR